MLAAAPTRAIRWVRGRASGARFHLRRLTAGSVETASWTAAKAVGAALDPIPAANWLLHGARDLDAAAQRAGVFVDAIGRIAPEDVIGNYLRGRILLGEPRRRHRSFTWLWMPQRGVIDPDSAHVPGRDRRYTRRAGFTIHFDSDFAPVVTACRRDDWTWITPEIQELYDRLFALGLASSIEVYQGDRLVGGTWGPLIGRTFGAKSIFHTVDHAGTAALSAMVDELRPGGRWDLVDVGPVKPSTARYGAHEVLAVEFKARVLAGLGAPGGER